MKLTDREITQLREAFEAALSEFSKSSAEENVGVSVEKSHSGGIKAIIRLVIFESEPK